MQKFGASTPNRLKNSVISIVFRYVSSYINFLIKIFLKLSENFFYILNIYEKKPAEYCVDILICRYEFLNKNLKSEELVSLDQTIGVEYKIFAWDVEWKWSESTGRKFENYVISSKFKIVFLSSWSESAEYFLSAKVMRNIRNKGIKIITINWDTATKKFWKNYCKWYDQFDLNVITDNPNKNNLNT